MKARAVRERDMDYYEYAIEVDGVLVRLTKLGGGTLGKAYVGSWAYVVTNRLGAVLDRGSDFTTGMPRTHVETAREIAAHFEEGE